MPSSLRVGTPRQPLCSASASISSGAAPRSKSGSSSDRPLVGSANAFQSHSRRPTHDPNIAPATWRRLRRHYHGTGAALCCAGWSGGRAGDPGGHAAEAVGEGPLRAGLLRLDAGAGGRAAAARGAADPRRAGPGASGRGGGGFGPQRTRRRTQPGAPHHRTSAEAGVFTGRRPAGRVEGHNRRCAQHRRRQADPQSSPRPGGDAGQPLCPGFAQGAPGVAPLRRA